MKPYNCPICDTPSNLLDVVDFNKNCEERRGTFLPKSGIPIYYAACVCCGFVFAPEFLNWTDDEFIKKIYNANYLVIDPDYALTRPSTNADLINKIFAVDRDKIRHLDYGGGNGMLSNKLVAHGWNSISYDPFPDVGQSFSNLGCFNLITAFEVFEHVPNPLSLMDNLSQLVEKEGLIFFSTLINDNNIKLEKRLDWWYASPRNGHISLYSLKSLKKLGEKFGFRFASMGVGYHLYFKSFPPWANALLSK